MNESGEWHEFLCNGRAWSVARRTSAGSDQTGLCFRRGDETRLLVFSRGALPSDPELESMSEEVLGVLLLRAVAQ